MKEYFKTWQTIFEILGVVDRPKPKRPRRPTKRPMPPDKRRPFKTR